MRPIWMILISIALWGGIGWVGYQIYLLCVLACGVGGHGW